MGSFKVILEVEQSFASDMNLAEELKTTCVTRRDAYEQRFSFNEYPCFYSTTSLTRKFMKKIIYVALLAVATFSANVNADSTGLVGTTVTPKPLPPSTDVTKTEYGNNYFECGGSMRQNADGSLRTDSTSITLLRKGANTKCYNGPNFSALQVVALTRRTGANNKSIQFLDSIDVPTKKKEYLAISGCTGAEVVLTKSADVEFFTQHIKAWKIIDNKFVPVTDLKSVRCRNEGYGS